MPKACKGVYWRVLTCKSFITYLALSVPVDGEIQPGYKNGWKRGQNPLESVSKGIKKACCKARCTNGLWWIVTVSDNSVICQARHCYWAPYRTQAMHSLLCSHRIAEALCQQPVLLIEPTYVFLILLLLLTFCMGLIDIILIICWNGLSAHLRCGHSCVSVCQ